MASHKVPIPQFTYWRATPKTPFLNWGKYATRKATTMATSKKLLGYRGCVAGQMAGKSYSNLKEVQEAFRAVAHACKGKMGAVE
jgi:hypothetical protein